MGTASQANRTYYVTDLLVREIGEITLNEKMPTQQIQTKNYHIFPKTGKSKILTIRITSDSPGKKKKKVISRINYRMDSFEPINMASFLSMGRVTSTGN